MEPPPHNPETRPSDASLPLRIGGYRVVKRLATGGTSDVLLARAEGPHGFERAVVLKLLLQQFREDEKFERMFAREAAAYARLSHPAIVKLYDFFSDSAQLVMVLEYIDGLPLHKLRALLRPKGWSLDDRAAMFIGWRVFSALSAAHSARDPQTGEYSPVIHRDVNPSNVLIPWDGHVKIADFGIAKVAGIDGETQAGLIKGTYGYMAPEQVRGEPLTIRADVYAASLLLWELLAGRKAIVRNNAADIDVLRAMAEPSFPSLSSLRPDLPKAVLEAVARGLEPDPDRRSIYADELCSALRTAISLDEGRQALIDVLALVRPPPVADDLAATTSRPPAALLNDYGPSDSQETLRFRSEVPPDLSPDDTLADPPKIPQAPLPPRPGLGITIPVTGAVQRAVSSTPPRPAAAVTLRMTSPNTSGAAAKPIAPSRPASKAPLPAMQTKAFPAPLAPGLPPLSAAPPAPQPAAGAPPRSPLPQSSSVGPPSPGAAFPPAQPPFPAPLPPAAMQSEIVTAVRSSPPIPPQPIAPAVPQAMFANTLNPMPLGVTAPMPAVRSTPPPAALSPLSAPPPGAVSPLSATVAAPKSSPPPAAPADPYAAHVSSKPPPSPQAAWTPGYPSSSTHVAALPARAPLWRGHRGWMFVIGICVIVSLCSIVVLILWTRDDTRASPPPKASADARALAAAGSTSSPGTSAPAVPPPVASATAAAVPPPVPSAPQVPAQTAPPAPASPPPAPPAAAATTGTINVPGKGGHRVWIDERLVGESPGAFSVRCGSHAVRIGSAGVVQHVNVPCGGAADLR